MSDTAIKEQEIKTINDTRSIFIDYIKNYLPHYLAASNPTSAGRTAELVFEAELNGDGAFSAGNFTSTRSRASCLIPYESFGNTPRALDILEVAFLQHAKEYHIEKYHEDRLNILMNRLNQLELTEIESQIIQTPRDFWNG